MIKGLLCVVDVENGRAKGKVREKAVKVFLLAGFFFWLAIFVEKIFGTHKINKTVVARVPLNCQVKFPTRLLLINMNHCI